MTAARFDVADERTANDVVTASAAPLRVAGPSAGQPQRRARTKKGRLLAGPPSSFVVGSLGPRLRARLLGQCPGGIPPCGPPMPGGMPIGGIVRLLPAGFGAPASAAFWNLLGSAVAQSAE